MNLEYMKEHSKQRYIELYNQVPLELGELNVHKVENATILPGRSQQKRLLGTGGVFDSFGNYVEESGVYSRGAYFHVGSEPIQTYFGGCDERSHGDPVIVDDDIVYLGYLFNHWGHFIVDLSARLWYVLKDNKCSKFCFVVREGSVFYPIENIQKFFKYLGIEDDQLIFVNKPMKFRNVYIPEVAYIANYFCHPYYLEVFETVSKRILSKMIGDSHGVYNKVYLTRTKLKKAQATETGEKFIEGFFQKNGYKIMSPEKCTLEEQIRIFSEAEDIVCMTGTIAHNLVFAPRGRSITILNKSDILNVMQRDINILKNIDVTFIDCYIMLEPVSLGSGPFCLVFNDLFKKYAQDKKLNFEERKIRCESIKSIKRYLKLIKRYDVQMIEKGDLDGGLHNLFSLENYMEFINEWASLICVMKWYEQAAYRIQEGVDSVSTMTEKVVRRIRNIVRKKSV